MPNSFQTDSSGLFARQQVSAYLDYAFDWSDWLQSGDSIQTSVWGTDSKLTTNTENIVGAITSVWIQGGTAGTWYAVTNTVTSKMGRTDSRTFRLYIYDDTEASSIPDTSLLFTDMVSAIASIRRDRLMLLASTLVDTSSLSDSYVWEKILAAEAQTARDLRVPLLPTQFFPLPPTADQIAALPPGMPWDVDPPYDYDPDFFRGEKWGYLVTRQIPIVSVQSIAFAYPSPANEIFTIPLDWLRMDQRYGHIRMVPATQAFSAPLSAFMMQALGGGRTIPFMIQLTYVAGLTNAVQMWPDLIDVIRKRAVLKIVQDGLMPQSGSISADGLSQSMSVDVDKYEDTIDRLLYGPKGSNGGLMTAIHGVRTTVMGF